MRKMNKIMEKIKGLDKKEVITIIGILLIMVALFMLPRLILGKDNTLPEVKLRELRNNGMFALMIPDDNHEGQYKEYTGNDLFPKGYLLNIDKSYCLDNAGQEVKGVLSRVKGSNSVTLKSNQTVYCTLYFEHSAAVVLIYDNTIKQKTGCTNVQCALDELYTVSYY